MRLSGSYTACSSGELGRAGSQGGLQTISDTRPSGNRSLSSTSTCPDSPSRSRFSRAQASARGSVSVAMTRLPPRRAITAARTPVPVPMSKATLPRGMGVLATRSTYSPRTGENTP
ncbi:hypothetical protein D3C72_1984030 [compost metagenome]